MSEQTMLNPRVLKIAVLVMGALLLLGFAVVIVTIAVRAAHPRPELSALPARNVAVALAPGGTVDHLILDGSRLVLDLADRGGRRVVVVDLNKGRATDIIRLGAEGAGAPASTSATP